MTPHKMNNDELREIPPDYPPSVDASSSIGGGSTTTAGAAEETATPARFSLDHNDSSRAKTAGFNALSAPHGKNNPSIESRPFVSYNNASYANIYNAGSGVGGTFP